MERETCREKRGRGRRKRTASSNSFIHIECSQTDCPSRSWNAVLELVFMSLTYLLPPPQTKSGLFNQR